VRALRGLYLTVGVLIGVLLPFVPVILEQRGFSVPAIGGLIALTALGYLVALPAWGHLGDVVLGRRRALVVAALASSLAALLFGAPLALPLVGLAVLAYYLVESGAGMLTDAIALGVLGARADRYGGFRLLESGSFAVAALAAGYLYDGVGYGLAYLLAAVAGVLVAITVGAVPDPRRAKGEAPDAASDAASPALATPGGAARGLLGAPDEQAAAHGPESEPPQRWWRAIGSVGTALSTAPRLVGVLAAVVLVHLGVLASFTFLPLRLAQLGGPPSVIALSATVSALFEIPAMLVVGRLVPVVGLRGLFALGCGLYAAAFVLWIVLADPAVIIATRLLTGLGYGALTVTIVLTVGSMLPARLQASGQALYGMSTNGLASIAANLVGGLLYGGWGHGPVFAASAVGALLAAMVAWRYFPARGQVRLGPRRG
jgi:PPP family 3-phenylpropionic acid transporter